MKPEKYKELYFMSSQLESINPQYRYTAPHLSKYAQWRTATVWNLITLVSRSGGGYASFSSTIENSSRKFDELFEIETVNMTVGRDTIPGLSQLLAGKYKIIEDAQAEKIVSQVSYDNKTLYIQEVEAFPIGFAVDHYALSPEVFAIPQKQRAIALMYAGAIYPQDENKVKQFADHINLNEINYEYPIDSLIIQKKESSVDHFERDSHGFSCKADFSSDRLVYFTVPYSTGWTVYVNGKETEIIDSCGMILLPVEQGQSNIQFVYHTPGLTEGVYISIVSLTVWVLLLSITIIQNVKHVASSGKGE